MSQYVSSITNLLIEEDQQSAEGILGTLLLGEVQQQVLNPAVCYGRSLVLSFRANLKYLVFSILDCGHIYLLGSVGKGTPVPKGAPAIDLPISAQFEFGPL